MSSPRSSAAMRCRIIAFRFRSSIAMQSMDAGDVPARLQDVELPRDVAVDILARADPLAIADRPEVEVSALAIAIRIDCSRAGESRISLQVARERLSSKVVRAP